MIHIVIPTTPERRARTAELVKSIQETSNGMEYEIVIFENELGGWVPAVRTAIQHIDGIVWLLGSDCIVEKDALKNLWEGFIHEFPAMDGVVEPYNEMHGDKLCQHPMAHRDTILKYLDARFTHWYSDNWFTILARRDYKLAYIPQARIQHNHFINKKAKVDRTYEKIFDEKTVAKDKALFEELVKTL